jgi:hypothetical protein
VANDKNEIISETEEDVSSRPETPDNLEGDPEALIKHPLQVRSKLPVYVMCSVNQNR